MLTFEDAVAIAVNLFNLDLIPSHVLWLLRQRPDIENPETVLEAAKEQIIWGE